MATRADRLNRIAIHRRKSASSRSGAIPRAPIGTLAWIEARQQPSQETAPQPPQPSPAERPEFYTREAAARRLGVGKTTVWELTSRGLIGVAYIGSKPLIPAVELDRYIAGLIEQARERAETCYRPQKRGR